VEVIEGQLKGNYLRLINYKNSVEGIRLH